MARIKRGLEAPPRRGRHDLSDALIEELKRNRESGQPIIDEQHFPATNTIRVNVIWDRWDGVSYDDRVATIFDAYREAEGQEACDRIAMAMGLTVPEAYESGLLPFQVLPLIRKDDPVSAEQCRQAMIDEGASLLFAPDKPQLRFATQEEAEACVKRLIQRLPGSEPVWTIAQDVGRIEPRVFA